MEVGLLETDTDLTGAGNPDYRLSSRHMRDVLLAKGYAVQYSECNSGHNMTSNRGTIANGLLELLGSLL